MPNDITEADLAAIERAMAGSDIKSTLVACWYGPQLTAALREAWKREAEAFDEIFHDVPESRDDNGEPLSVAGKIKLLRQMNIRQRDAMIAELRAEREVSWNALRTIVCGTNEYMTALRGKHDAETNQRIAAALAGKEPTT